MKDRHSKKAKRDRSPTLTTDAWLLRGFSYAPGVLKLADGHLSFTASGFGTLWKRQLDRLERDARQPGLAARMDQGERVVLFDVPLAEVQITFPWYYFSGGLKVKAQGVRYRISFGRPPQQQGPEREFRTVCAMRRVGKRWRTILHAELHN